MLFNSLAFLCFFIVVSTTYFILPHKARWLWLLVASCYFYMSFIPVYILILGFTIVIDYFAGIYLEKETGKIRKYFLVASLIANIGILAVFKYYNFFIDNINEIGHVWGVQRQWPLLGIVLPIGLSFHTFQAMSYTIEVYRGNQKAERHFGIYALYVMFYPQLVAGPIERPQNLLHQFKERHEFDYFRVVAGLKLMLWGLFKKVVIADRLSLYTDAVYNNPAQHGGLTIIVATIFFAFQIYCDFSGYSDIAIGSARVMGFELMTNFRVPYFSRSIGEFWKRWHISLSTWFKDYLYIPLGGNRVVVSRIYFNLLFVFIVSGVWHGANWTFVVWGALNGIYLVAEILFQKIVPTSLKEANVRNSDWYIVLATFSTFILTSLAWVFFRAASLKDAELLLKNMCHINHSFFSDMPTLSYGTAGILFLVFIERKMWKKNSNLPFETNRWWVSQFLYLSLILLILIIGVFDGGQFIYFQF
jgi:alginate O-acetyltransferase complex protein AlgI